MESIIEIADKLSAASLATVVICILLAGWKQIWVFGYQLMDAKTESKLQLDAMREERNEWKELALRSTGLAETSVTIAARRG